MNAIWLCVTLALSITAYSADHTTMPDPQVVAADDGPIAFVQLFEWTWPDVARECEEHLGPAGYTAAQVSPPNEHIEGPAWWTRYQPVSYKIESRGGSRAEFADMVARCKAVGVGIYADAVINHMAGMPEGVGVAGSPFSEYNYPGLYDHDDFHHCGLNDEDTITNYQNLEEIQTCQLGTLDDLDTGKPSVQATLAAYLDDLVGLGVAGFRLDAVKHIDHDELHEILGQVRELPFLYQEVIDRGGEPISAANYLRDGKVTEFKYPSVILQAFHHGNLDALTDFSDGSGWLPADQAVIFVDNHDIQRGHATSEDVVNYKKGQRYNLAVAFMLGHPYGYPLVMSSYAFEGDSDGPPANSPFDADGCGETWICEHRRDSAVAMVRFRSATMGTALENWRVANSLVSFSRGNKGHLLINTATSDSAVAASTSLAPGRYTDLVSGRQVMVGDNGLLELTLAPETVLAILAE